VGLIELRAANCLAVIVSEPLRVIGEHNEALFECLKFTSFTRTVGDLHELSVFDRLFAVLAWREHAEPFLEVPRAA
jgi:hypothetical protein